MKQLSFIFFFLMTFSANSQIISGKIVDDNRKMISKTTFVLESNYEGYVVYEIAVNPNGEVISSKMIDDKSTVFSTPANMEAKNFLKTIVFEKGNHFPKYHHANVKVVFVKSKTVKSFEIDLN
ncbi:MAG: hypothetical protein PHQ74_06550 [Crocinitomicaceae bacterium]|nr:hypothetical protein [Crocinitomicaceae bacterium]